MGGDRRTQTKPMRTQGEHGKLQSDSDPSSGSQELWGGNDSHRTTGNLSLIMKESHGVDCIQVSTVQSLYELKGNEFIQMKWKRTILKISKSILYLEKKKKIKLDWNTGTTRQNKKPLALNISHVDGPLMKEQLMFPVMRHLYKCLKLQKCAKYRTSTRNSKKHTEVNILVVDRQPNSLPQRPSYPT